MHPESLLASVNAQHGTTFTLVDRYPHGESASGAYAVVDVTGQRGILKWDDDPNFVRRLQDVAAATVRLRERGYPAPFSLVVGRTPACAYSIQEMLPGAPMCVVTPDFVPRLIELNLLQRGLGLPGPVEWPGRVVDTVHYGGEGYCLLDPLRTYSAETAELLTALQALVARQQGARHETGDLVHFDFNPMNILVESDAVSGVVDWQDPCAGDCAFDLATMLFYAWDSATARDHLWQHVLTRVGPGALGIYLAHLILRQVDWSIRHHGPEVTASWLRVAREILGQYRALGAV